MAAINFYMNITDGGDTGSGPYTVTLIKNATTAASGGTTLQTFSAAGGPNVTGANTQNIRELIQQAMNWISNTISTANQNDSLN